MVDVSEKILFEEKNKTLYMKHLKLYEQFELDDDPWGEDTPRKRTFWDWFQNDYAGRDPGKITSIDCSGKDLVSLEGIGLKAKIVSLSETKKVLVTFRATTKNSFAKECLVRTAVIQDSSGKIKLTLWDNYANEFSEGQNIRLIGCYAKKAEYEDENKKTVSETILVTGKYGVIQKD
jgi:hypothetical protein